MSYENALKKIMKAKMKLKALRLEYARDVVELLRELRTMLDRPKIRLTSIMASNYAVAISNLSRIRTYVGEVGNLSDILKDAGIDIDASFEKYTATFNIHWHTFLQTLASIWRRDQVHVDDYAAEEITPAELRIVSKVEREGEVGQYHDVVTRLEETFGGFTAYAKLVYEVIEFDKPVTKELEYKAEIKDVRHEFAHLLSQLLKVMRESRRDGTNCSLVALLEYTLLHVEASKAVIMVPGDSQILGPGTSVPGPTLAIVKQSGEVIEVDPSLTALYMHFKQKYENLLELELCGGVNPQCQEKLGIDVTEVESGTASYYKVTNTHYPEWARIFEACLAKCPSGHPSDQAMFYSTYAIIDDEGYLCAI